MSNKKVKEIEVEINTMKKCIKWFRTQIGPHDCGWMYTTIDGIKHYITKLRKDIRNEKKK